MLITTPNRRARLRSFEQGTAAVAQTGPKLANLVVGHFLADLAIALQPHDQANPICKLLKILMKGQPLWSPIVAAIVAEGLNRCMHNRFIRITEASAKVRQGGGSLGRV